MTAVEDPVTTGTGTGTSPAPGQTVGVEHDRPQRLIPQGPVSPGTAPPPAPQQQARFAAESFAAPSTSWTLTTFDSYVADCGPYIGPWPILAPFPDNVPDDSSEVDYLISPVPLAQVVDGTYSDSGNPGYYQVQVINNDGSWSRDVFMGYDIPSGTYPISAQHAPPAGSHLYVVWYATPYGSTPTAAPDYDALTLVPASYATGGSAATPAFDTYVPLNRLGTPSAGQILSRTQYTTVTYPVTHNQGNWQTEGAFGQPAVGILPDKSVVVAAPWFYQSAGSMAAPVEGGNDNNIKIKVWHLAADLSPLGELLVNAYTTTTGSTPDTWGWWANCALAVNRSTEPGKVLLVLFNQRSDTFDHPDTFARSHSWVLDCTGNAPVIATMAGVPRYESLASRADLSLQAVGYPQLDLGNGTALVAYQTQHQNQLGAALFNWSNAQLGYGYDSGGFHRNPIAFYADPDNPQTRFAIVHDSGLVWIQNDLAGGSLTDAGTSYPDFVYYAIGAGNPFETYAMMIDQMNDQWDLDGQFSALHQVIGAPNFVTTGPFEWNVFEQGVNGSGTWNSARVGPQLFVASDQLWRDPIEGGNSGAFLRLYLVDHSNDEVKTDTAELVFPLPIAPTTCSAAIAGSDAIDATDETVVCACFILDQYGTSDPVIRPTLVVWTVPVAPLPTPPGEPMAATAHIYRVIQDAAGNIIIGAQVSFCEPGTDIPIGDQLYADEALQTKLDNPYISLDGIMDVYLARPRTVSVHTSFNDVTQTADYMDVLSNAENILAAQGPVTIDNDAFTGAVLRMVGDQTAEWTDPSVAAGAVSAVAPGTHISVNNANPAVPVVSATGLVEAVQPGAGISVDATNPARPIIIATTASEHNVLTGQQDDPSGISITATNAGAGSSIAKGTDSIAIGDGADAEAPNSVVIGGNAFANTGCDNATVIGNGAYANLNATYGIAIGDGAVVQADRGTVIGNGAYTQGVAATSLGNGATTGGAYSVAVGRASAGGDGAVAIGANAQGDRAIAQTAGDVAVGGDAQARGNDGTVPHAPSDQGATSAVAIGVDSWASARSVAIGVETSSDVCSVTIGRSNSWAGHPGQVCVGVDTIISADYAIGIGYAVAMGDSIGQHAPDGAYSISIGAYANAKKDNSIAIGSSSYYSTAARTGGQKAIAIGQNANAAANQAVSIGANSSGNQISDLAVGYAATAWSSTLAATAIGESTSANANAALALGKGAQASHAGGVAIGTNSTGTGAATTAANDFVLGTSAHNVKVPGTLALAADPASALQAATKQYVDAHSGTGGMSDPTTTKGDLIVHGATTTRFGVGSNGLVLTADSTQASGLKWAAAAAAGAMNYKGVWAAGAYAVGDVVSYQNKLYVCTTAVAAGASYVGNSGGNAPAGGGTANIALPAGTQAGDVLIAATSCFWINGAMPAGFTQIANPNPGGTKLQLSWKAATAGDISSGFIAFPGQSGNVWASSLHAFRGVSGPDSVIGANGSLTTASITPTVPGFLMSLLASREGSAGLTVTQANLSGYRSQPTTNPGTAADQGFGVYGGYETYVSGAAPNRTFVVSGGSLAEQVSANFVVLNAITFPASSFTEIAAIHDSNGRLQAADPSASSDLVTLSYHNSHLGTGLQSRTTATATTSSLAAGATDSTTTITLAQGYRLYSVQTSRKARVRLYCTAAQKTADLSRAVGTDPTSDAGVMFEYVTPDAAVHTLSPLVDGANLESSPSATISMSVTNNDTVTGTVAVTLNWLRTE